MNYQDARQQIKSGALGYRGPENARFNIRYGRPAAPILSSYRSMHPHIIPNIFNVAFCKFSCRVQHTLRFVLPVLANFISHIIGICAKKQMLRVYTICIIALMKYLQAFRYRSESSLPSDVVRKSSNTTIAHSPISGATIFCAKPVYTACFSFSRRKIGKPVLCRLSSKVVGVIARTHCKTLVSKIKALIEKQYDSIHFYHTEILKKGFTYAIL
jgi:hypothetical protein